MLPNDRDTDFENLEPQSYLEITSHLGYGNYGDDESPNESDVSSSSLHSVSYLQDASAIDLSLQRRGRLVYDDHLEMDVIPHNESDADDLQTQSGVVWEDSPNSRKYSALSPMTPIPAQENSVYSVHSLDLSGSPALQYHNYQQDHQHQNQHQHHQQQHLRSAGRNQPRSNVKVSGGVVRGSERKDKARDDNFRQGSNDRVKPPPHRSHNESRSVIETTPYRFPSLESNVTTPHGRRQQQANNQQTNKEELNDVPDTKPVRFRNSNDSEPRHRQPLSQPPLYPQEYQNVARGLRYTPQSARRPSTTPSSAPPVHSSVKGFSPFPSSSKHPYGNTRDDVNDNDEDFITRKDEQFQRYADPTPSFHPLFESPIEKKKRRLIKEHISSVYKAKQGGPPFHYNATTTDLSTPFNSDFWRRRLAERQKSSSFKDLYKRNSFL